MSSRTNFLLGPDVVFLNHGSFGATPIPVLEAQREWQERLERQPVAFLGRELMGYLEAARGQLGAYVHAPPEDVVFIPNVTYGLNLIARALSLNKGDKVLTTNHEYGACNFIWDFIAEKTGVEIIRREIDLPLGSANGLVDWLWERVTPETRVIFLSHITSPTAQIFPVRELCEKARDAGLLTVIDGAHAPGQIPVDLSSLAPDFYLGNCHKWMMGPKGSGFLYTRPDKQHLIEPLVVSWGWGKDYQFSSGSKYLDQLQWSGTHNPAPFLAVPAAIHFQAAHDWHSVRSRSHELLVDGLARISALTGLPEAYSEGYDGCAQMGIARLPEVENPIGFQAELYRVFRVEVPIIQWSGGQYVRVSVQGYNTISDIDCLVAALEHLLPTWLL